MVLFPPPFFTIPTQVACHIHFPEICRNTQKRWGARKIYPRQMFSHLLIPQFCLFSFFPTTWPFLMRASKSNFLRVLSQIWIHVTALRRRGIQYGLCVERTYFGWHTASSTKVIFKFRSWFTIKRRSDSEPKPKVCKWKWNFLLCLARFSDALGEWRLDATYCRSTHNNVKCLPVKNKTRFTLDPIVTSTFPHFFLLSLPIAERGE